MNIMLLGLLNYSRVTSHGEQFTRVDLNKVVSEVLSDLDGRILETGGKVEIEELPIIHADPLQIQQLFQNLIGNALKYHRPNVPPIVNITCSVSKEKVAEIRIQDNGVGFDIKNGNRLFEPFTRLHGRSEFEGAGMGLAICKKIVERHNGTITASSTPGEGAIFTITLPVGE